jgi:cytochrome P450 family 142 subfamily A polypeptide 1
MSFDQTDLMSLSTHTDNPEPFYEWLREEEPLYYDEANELWAVSRYDDVRYVSEHTELFCSGKGVIPKLGTDIWPDEAMINRDGREHTCQRTLVSTGFTPRHIVNWEVRIRDITRDLVNQIAPRGEACLVQDLARPLPYRLIAFMLGYPKEVGFDVLDWTDTFTHAGCGPDHVTEEVVEAFDKFTEFHEALLLEKKASPGEELISTWLNAELDGERLSEDKLLFEHALLLVGGSETTRSAIAMGMQALLSHPEQMQWLCENLDDEGIVSNAVDEMIRWSCPFVRMRRTATQDVRMHDKTIREDDEIIMLYPAANRDPRAFDNPQEFDIRREFRVPHLSFGHGKHFCLGANLARLETRVMVTELLARLPDMKLAGEPLRSPSSFVRTLSSCPVTFGAQ